MRSSIMELHSGQAMVTITIVPTKEECHDQKLPPPEPG